MLGDGGELRLFIDDENTEGGERHVDVPPRGDRLLLFQSRKLEHEVLSTNAERYACTVWFY